jgi:hypothetical protein
MGDLWTTCALAHGPPVPVANALVTWWERERATYSRGVTNTSRRTAISIPRKQARRGAGVRAKSFRSGAYEAKFLE